MTARTLGGPLPYAHYDRRRYRTLSVREGYAIWSTIYGDHEDRLDLDLLDHSPLLRERVPGARVVDLACGTGRIGRWLAARGEGAICGVDTSDAMLARAAERGAYAELVHADVCATALPGASFDGAVCSMALDHVADLDAFFAEARRLLAPGGWLAVVDYHPHFLMSGIPTHFDSPETGEPIAIENHVHGTAAYFNAARRSGLGAVEFEERFVDEEWATVTPGLRKYLGLPVTLFWAFESR